MKPIFTLNTKGQHTSVFPENVKSLSKTDFVKKFKKHLAKPEQVYEQVQKALKGKAS